MKPTYPSLFISHGSPDLILQMHPSVDALKSIGQSYHQPEAIVVVSAHWIKAPIRITSAKAPPTIHDFGGFPAPLYDLDYPAPGHPRLAESIRKNLKNQGMEVTLDSARGLDHGVWIPLLLMFPHADFPVIQISLPKGDLKQCVQLGETLKPLREQGVLIIGSGGSVHNLSAVDPLNNTTEPWASSFQNWLSNEIEDNHFDSIINPQQHSSIFDLAHPTLEHYAPLPLAWAAGNKQNKGKLIHESFMYGNIGMGMYEFS